MLLDKLRGKVSPSSLRLVEEGVRLRFDKDFNYSGKETLILHEQGILSESELRELLEDEGYYFEVPSYVHQNIHDALRGQEVIALEIDNINNQIIVGDLKERLDKDIIVPGLPPIKKVALPLYLYVELYTPIYGKPKFLLEYSALDLFNFIVDEAIELGASDLTISDRRDRVAIYYNVNKRKVNSTRRIEKSNMREISELIKSRSSRHSSLQKRGSVYCSIDLNPQYRGRVVINSSHFGETITLRILSNKTFNKSFEDLSLPEDSIRFIRDEMLSLSPGLKLIVGPTMSGKNTTIVTALKEIYDKHDIKIVSVENPVEIITDFMEQLDTDSEDDYNEAVNSLTRQNPDLVYITEMTDYTATGTMKVANTGKAVFTTIHANSVSDVIPRLKDLTNYSLNEILMMVDSIYFQQLIQKKCKYCNDEGCPKCYRSGMIPIVEYLRLTSDIKRDLIGKELHEINAYINDLMAGRRKIDLARKYLEDGHISQKAYEQWFGREGMQ